MHTLPIETNKQGSKPAVMLNNALPSRPDPARACTSLAPVNQSDSTKSDVLIDLEKVNLGAEEPLSREMILKAQKTCTTRKKQAIHLANDLIKNFAGPDTAELEDRFKKWQKEGGGHDRNCVVCFHAIDLGACETMVPKKCRTCQRNFHLSCTAGFRPCRQTKFHCPLCVKRLRNQLEPNSIASRYRREDITMALTRRLLDDPKFPEKLNLRDDGSLLNDHELLQQLKDLEPELPSVWSVEFSGTLHGSGARA